MLQFHNLDVTTVETMSNLDGGVKHDRSNMA